MRKLRTVISTILSSAILFVVLVAQAETEETDEMSPFKDRRIPKDTSSPHSDRDPITGERIYTLTPFVVRPMLPDTEKWINVMKDDPKQFRTEKGWRLENRGESAVDAALNPSFLPTLGLSKVEIAKMRTTDIKMAKRLQLLDSIIDISKVKDDDYGEELGEQRYELMKMKREAINFGFDGW